MSAPLRTIQVWLVCLQDWIKKRLFDEVLPLMIIFGFLIFSGCAVWGVHAIWSDVFGKPAPDELIQAAYLNDDDKVGKLLAAGADPNRLDTRYYAAVDVAEVQGATRVVDLLVQHGARRGLSNWFWAHQRAYDFPLE